jgi:N-acetylglucosamine-6-phosphate deacetylase
VTERISARRVVLPCGIVGPAAVLVGDDGVISAIEPSAADAPDRTLVPGFIDLQVNGIDDVDVWSATGTEWARLDAALVTQGVTSWCPTLVSAPLDSYAAPLQRITTAGARLGARPAIVGCHLEGPFLGGAPGAHRPEHVRDIDLDWLARVPEIVRVLTLAPEQHDAATATSLLAERGVLVSLGHSTADARASRHAIDHGARLVTHVFNGMGPLHHRSPGLLGVALSDDRVAVSLIADGIHVDPAVLTIALRSKRRTDIVLVTDSVAWRAGRAGDLELRVVDGVPRLADGTLAGSTLTMDGAVRFVTRRCGLPLEHAAQAAASTPARLLGLSDRGTIEPGRRADLVSLDESLAVGEVWIGGAQVR